MEPETRLKTIKKGNQMKTSRIPVLFLVSWALAGCLGSGGGGGEAGNTQTNPTTPDSRPENGGEIPPLPYDPTPIEQALHTGDASALTDADARDLLEAAQAVAIASKASAPRIADIVPDLPPQPFNVTGSSHTLKLNSIRSSVPLLLTADNRTLVAASVIGKGRAISYGPDLIPRINGDTSHPAYNFAKSTTAWLLTGNKNTFPSTVRYAVGGKANAKNNPNALPALLQAAGATPTLINCDILVENSCWQDADLMVVYQTSTDDAAAGTQTAKYLAAGKPVLYISDLVRHSGFNYNVNAALNLTAGGRLPGTDEKPVGLLTPAQIAAAHDETNKISKRIELVETLLNKEDLAAPADWTEHIDLIDFIAREYKGEQFGQPWTNMNRQKDAYQNLFTMGSDYDFHKYLVLWADLYRRDHAVYDNSVSYNKGKPISFLRQMASDTWTHAVRSVALAPRTLGQWMPAASKDLPVSNTPEEITVTIPNQAMGSTLIGRMAVPGKALTIEVVDDDGVGELLLRTGFIRRYPEPMPGKGTEMGVYHAPRLPGDHHTLLDKTQPNVRNYSMGGPLVLMFRGNPQGDRVVKLRITGTAKYGHWDYTQPMSEAEKQLAMEAVKSGMGGWLTTKFVAGELQQAPMRVGKVESVEEVDQWAYEMRKWVFQFNHEVHGYHNTPLTPKQAELCTQFGWDCTSRAYHGAPGVQHFVGWWALCGYACSGNPSDVNGKTKPEWASLHELGHNTVTAMETMYTCGTECNNNLVASLSWMGAYADSGGRVGSKNERLRHWKLYEYLAGARATGKTDEALRADVYDRIWAQGDTSVKLAVSVQIATLYTKERLGMTHPSADKLREFMGLVNKGWRLKEKTWDGTNKQLFAMGAYANKNDISNEDGFYVLSSKVIGKDLRKVFQMYGFKLDQRALDSVAALGLPVQDEVFYALPQEGCNRLHEGKWLDLNGKTPAYPTWHCVDNPQVSCTLTP
ncbi:ImpA family metalloprotease [Crenobacter caeni]|uniref:Immunomodulating metalloprotease N-terminal domain-containing protein n=1 Tax=Crenobacter caeni TaxID=2705474 RepID=A0A6B2KRS5_9NEIS|nr:ImpA family metalloprotease [Crenobacter caeni]NDV12946.1 hypothetical protein [Crenobacter caeni]